MAKFNYSSEMKDVYQRVTDKIVADLEAGVRTWLQPWKAGKDGVVRNVSLPLRHDGTPYRGINVFMLWGETAIMGYTHSIWMTFKQAQALGGHVKKGEHGTLVVYANKTIKTEQGAGGEDIERVIPFMKGYTVFNVEQIEGLPAHYYGTTNATPTAPMEKRIEAVDTFVRNAGARVIERGAKAFYSPSGDFIQMPPSSTFGAPEGFSSTLLHELVHWTGHDKRCARTFGRVFGNEQYAAEELVAELGAAFLCADLGVPGEARPDHAAYVASWLKVLKGDKRAIFKAATMAQAASDYLHGLQGKTVEIEDEKLAAD